ncbi:Hypothetical predicted protein [Paramuricea clavata]|uniref:Uncharacterized protein n=1 Tax=Paramuricea clavata TaxID=317549 RepID=A0A6S7HUX6_PARCT|nr:Hypothetical predicted protein [Paramuricea clavata]
MTRANKDEFSSDEELVKLIDLSPKGPVYYQCKDILLGEGGYGKVFKGFAVTAGKKPRIQPVAIKTGFNSQACLRRCHKGELFDQFEAVVRTITGRRLKMLRSFSQWKAKKT